MNQALAFAPTGPRQINTQFRRDMNIIGLVLSLLVFFFIINGFVSEYLKGFLLPLRETLSDEDYYSATVLVDSFVYALNFLIPAIVMRVALKMGGERLLPGENESAPPSEKSIFNIFLSIFLVLLMVEVGATISGAVLDWFYSIGFDFYIDIEQRVPTGVFGIIAQTVSVAVMPAVFEELLFRGCVLGALRRYGAAFAIFFSAAVFALMHCTVQQFLYAFCAGLGLGWLTYSTGRLWPAILCHFINNGLSVAYDYVFTYFGDIAYMAVYAAFSAVILILGVTGLIFIIRKGGHISEGSRQSLPSLLLRRSFVPGTVIYLVLVALLTMLVVLPL